MPSSEPRIKVITKNRRARRDFKILTTYECGLVLAGSEVKSLREGAVQVAEAYGKLSKGEVWLHSMHVSPYSHSGPAYALDPGRPRKLLLHRSEINRIRAKVEQDGYSLVPLSVYFKDGKAKVELAVVQRHRKADKRADLAKREADREARRALVRTQRDHDRDKR